MSEEQNSDSVSGQIVNVVPFHNQITKYRPKLTINKANRFVKLPIINQSN